MKVLFLDVDGVLNSTRSAVGLGNIPHDAKPEDLPFFDLVALGMIREVCKETGAQIVLSSTWRIGRDAKAFGAQLDLPIIDKTPDMMMDGDKVRGDEIAHWLADHPEVTRYAIVDDDSDMLQDQMPRFVKTTFEDGLQWSHYKRLVELL